MTLRRQSLKRTIRFAQRNSGGLVCLLGLLLTPVSTSAGLLCLRLESSGRILNSVPAEPGNQFRLGFIHSLYGSKVEEVFTIREQGLELVRLRYAEPRLVEFYGHDQARYEDGLWVVTPPPAVFPALDVRVSPGASMDLFLDLIPSPVKLFVRPGEALHITVSSCRDGTHG